MLGAGAAPAVVQAAVVAKTGAGQTVFKAARQAPYTLVFQRFTPSDRFRFLKGFRWDGGPHPGYYELIRAVTIGAGEVVIPEVDFAGRPRISIFGRDGLLSWTIEPLMFKPCFNPLPRFMGRIWAEGGTVN